MFHLVAGIKSFCLLPSLWYQFLRSRLTYFSSPITSSSFDSPLCSSITPSLFHPRLKTCFTNSSPSSFTSFYQTAFTDYRPDSFFWATRFLFIVFPYCFVSVPCDRLSWPSSASCQLNMPDRLSYRIVS